MKVVAYNSGSLIALFSLEAFTPLPFTGERAILQKIQQRYQFARAPSLAAPAEELEEHGLLFNVGEFQTQKGVATIQKFSIHRDGVVVVAATTEVAEGFFDDIYGWLTSELAFRPVPINRLYLSELTADFDQPVANLFKNFDAVSKLIAAQLPQANRPDLVPSLYSFTVDLTLEGKSAPRFAIERRAGAGPTEDRYFCVAPLQTTQHLATLDAIEQLLK